MKRAFLGVLLCTLIATFPVAAASSPVLQTAVPQPTSQLGPDPSLLLVQLSTVQPVSRVFDISYSVDGELVFAERLTFEQPGGTTDPELKNHPSAVELLAWHPDVRGFLLRAAATDAFITVTVAPHDEAPFTLDFGELRADSHALQAKGAVPVETQSETLVPQTTDLQGDNSSPGNVLSPKTACESNCYYEYNSCENGCGIDQQCIWLCDHGLQLCLDDCNNPGCTGPTYEDSTATTVESIQIVGGSACNGPVGYPGIGADYVRLVLKYTTTRTTTYCDGSQDSEVISTTYSAPMYCWYLSGYCNPAGGFVSPVCPI